MELIILLLLISSTGDDPKRMLRSALDFYRQNRELIELFRTTLQPTAQGSGGMTQTEAPQPGKENRPPTADGNFDIFEHFLKNQAVGQTAPRA